MIIDKQWEIRFMTARRASGKHKKKAAVVVFAPPEASRAALVELRDDV